MTNQPHKEIPKLNLQNFSFDTDKSTANIEEFSDKDIIELLNRSSHINNEDAPSSSSTLQKKPMTSTESSKKMKKTYTIVRPINELETDISSIVHHLSLAQKYGFFLGIQVVSESNEKLKHIHRDWVKHNILYSHFSFIQELDDETKLLQDLFKGSSQKVANKVAYEWLPKILKYLHTHDEMYKEEILVDFFMNYKGLTVENVVYSLTLALEYNVPIHYANGSRIGSMSLKVLMDALLNPYSFVANLEQMLESNILALQEVAKPLHDMYTPSTKDEMYYSTIDEHMNLYVAIKTYFINIFFRKLGEDVYDQFITTLTSGKMATFLVPTEVSMIFESFITDIQKQTPNVPNLLFSMVDSDGMNSKGE
ncbi:hypothetical protein ABD87_22980 [Lysinibacillus sphaericus]|uniref:hypothetical protein n=1 Tax=Lysinibacillus sphaericus TaxID=1421 RepID=UPI0018CD730C|nr:hypothetical protein [Lysinibacillus sphaericus]MBG9732291.1 hypothetical protein [Lysinibacillus sphaericus]